MATSWYDGYAKCPFYIQDNRKNRIECCGVADSSRLVWKMETNRDYKIQIETFCCEHYKKCEVYQMLKNIYEED